MWSHQCFPGEVPKLIASTRRRGLEKGHQVVGRLLLTPAQVLMLRAWLWRRRAASVPLLWCVLLKSHLFFLLLQGKGQRKRAKKASNQCDETERKARPLQSHPHNKKRKSEPLHLALACQKGGDPTKTWRKQRNKQEQAAPATVRGGGRHLRYATPFRR